MPRHLQQQPIRPRLVCRPRETFVREIVFKVLSNLPGRWSAEAQLPSGGRQIAVRATSLEELHHEARDALIEHLGAVHAAYRVRIEHITSRPTALA